MGGGVAPLFDLIFTIYSYSKNISQIQVYFLKKTRLEKKFLQSRMRLQVSHDYIQFVSEYARNWVALYM